MNTQLRWIAAAVAALAVDQVSAQGYYTNPNYARGNGYGNGYTHVVRCESYGGRSNFCRVNAQGRVFIVRQLSQQRCMRGRNWNADFRGIWVGGGCRADFAIAPRRGYRQGGGYAMVQGGGYGMQGGYGMRGGGYGMQGGGYGLNVDGARGWNGDPEYMNNQRMNNQYMNNQARAYDDRGDPNRAAGYNNPGYNNPRYGNNDPRYGNTDPRYNNNDPRYNNNPRAMNHSRDDDRDSDQDAGAPPDDPGYDNQPQH